MSEDFINENEKAFKMLQILQLVRGIEEELTLYVPNG